MKKVQVELTAKSCLTQVVNFVLELPDEIDQDDLLALDPSLLEEIANECCFVWEDEGWNWSGVDRDGVAVVSAAANDHSHARLMRGEDGKIAWQRVEQQESSLARRIRRSARTQHLIAQKSRKDGLWYFADEGNRLLSPENGLASPQALEWLRQPG
jgi:hypothetical protein